MSEVIILGLAESPFYFIAEEEPPSSDTQSVKEGLEIIRYKEEDVVS